MYVSPQTLDLHLSEVKRYFELVHLDDWLRLARQQAPLPRLACALTFDDGWRDNFEFALPVLTKHGAPATVFLVSSYVGGEQRFWPNRLMRLVRKAFAEPPSVLFPQPLLSLIEPVLRAAAVRGQIEAADIDGVVERAKAFPEAVIRELITAAENGGARDRQARDILNREEIAEMAATGLVRFGCHSATHHRFDGKDSFEDLEREIVLSQRDLKDVCGQPIEVFCYPNGDTSAAAIDLVRRHYIGAVTTEEGWHRAGEDSYLIRRIGLYEEKSASPQSFLTRLSTWL
jgi:peptidoglycan/xylan/chitin deacetylase (PgdA/CDA1 family)